ncbi:hypothetical protein ATN79_06125 [Paraburkholderia caribensis]|nr:hypothetical protein ATN79_06125 [Paraburkholderia caribensis]
MECQMIGRKVGVPQHMFVLRPATQLHQPIQRRARLDVPACPSVPDIVEPKILDIRSLTLVLPLLTRHMRDDLAAPRENVRRVLPDPAPNDGYSFVIQRHADGFTGLGLIRMNPRTPLH